MPWRCSRHLGYSVLFFDGFIYLVCSCCSSFLLWKGIPRQCTHARSSAFPAIFCLHYGILVFLWSMLLIRMQVGGVLVRAGFYGLRCGGTICELWGKALRTPRVKDRVVAAKMEKSAIHREFAVASTIVLSLVSNGQLIWNSVTADSREHRLGPISVSRAHFFAQSFIILKVLARQNRSRNTAGRSRANLLPAAMAMTTPPPRFISNALTHENTSQKYNVCRFCSLCARRWRWVSLPTIPRATCVPPTARLTGRLGL